LMRLLIDMNLTPRWGQHLRGEGHDAAHWSSVGMHGAKDCEICDYAREHGYVLLTNDLDFPQILAHTRNRHPASFCCEVNPSCRRFVGTHCYARLRITRLNSWRVL